MIRGAFAVMLTFILASLILIGSSGTFVSLNTAREVRVSVVPHEKEYLGFLCDNGYSTVVYVTEGSERDFEALTVRNHLNELKDVSVSLVPDYSGLSGGVRVSVETEDGSWRTISSEGEYTFSGHVDARNALPGTYTVPVEMLARWSGGDSWVSVCPMKVVVVGKPTIVKSLVRGNETVPANTPQRWTFRITVRSPGMTRNLTVKDVIPEGLAVDDVEPTSGNYSLTGNTLLWNVRIDANRAASIDVSVHTLTDSGGNVAFTSCGEHALNDGASIEGYNVTSNGLKITATCGEGDCRMCVSSRVISGPLFIKRGKPADYHTEIFVKNRGNAKDVVIEQVVGPDFVVTNHSASRGTVSTRPYSGGTLVIWRFHLGAGESASLELYEHTDGINSRTALLIGRVHIDGCGCTGCPKYVHTYQCSCEKSPETSVSVKSENCKGECG